jgi:hypothetical protein
MVRSLHADHVGRRSAVKWRNLSLLDDQLLQCAPASGQIASGPSSTEIVTACDTRAASRNPLDALLVHCILERFAGSELDGRRRDNLKRLAGLWVAPRSGRTRACAERSEPDKLNRVALDHCVCHRRRNASIVSAAADFVVPASCATASMSSCLFMFVFSNLSERQLITC